jgi:hypothetical protein
VYNVYLNGEVVRCPDTAAIIQRSIEEKERHRICKYNYQEDNCQVWQQSLLNWQSVKKNNTCGHCMLSNSDVCPGHRERKQLGSQQKFFKIDNQTYRKLASTAHYMVKESDYRTLFLTLTFPKFKRKYTYEEINKCFSKFVENLRKNYDCKGYIAVREFGKKTHRVHFHILCSIPYHNFSDLNRAWCSAISDISDFSPNAVTSDPKTRFISNPIRAMRYVCKYFSKAKGQRSHTRLVFLSNNIIQKPKQYRYNSEKGLLDSFKFDYQKQTSDYTTCYRITDNTELERFFDEFVYPFFELSTKNTDFSFSPPDNSS